MKRVFKRGQEVRRIGESTSAVLRGRTYRVSHVEGVRITLIGVPGEYEASLFEAVSDPDWLDVRPGDTAEFKVQGDTLSIKAQGEESQPTVLGWKTTELDGVWELLSIKKRNPPVPTRFGAKVEYRGKQWMLLYAAMLPPLRGGKHGMVWVEINETTFNWVGHMDIDREKFEVIFTGWQNT